MYIHLLTFTYEIVEFSIKTKYNKSVDNNIRKSLYRGVFENAFKIIKKIENQDIV